jgi:hypothetical protein
VAIAALFAGSAFAQGIDYSRFQRATLDALGANLAAGVAKDKSHVPRVGDRAFDGSLSGWVVEVAYGGALRPMSAEEVAFVRDGFKSIRQESLADLYDQSMLFRVDGKDHWLPVPSAVIPYFSKELKVGDKIDLYVLQSGGLLRKDGWDWLFLVMDFKKPQ